MLLHTPHGAETETEKTRDNNAALPTSGDPWIQANMRGSPSAAPPTAHVEALLAYLDARLCVPRDMGAPPAAALRALSRR